METTTTVRRGFPALERLLQTHGIEHAVVHHGCTYTAAAEARVAAVPPQHAAKTVMLRDAAGYVAAVVPVSEQLDLSKARRLTSRPQLRLATEPELTADFTAFDAGAFPPFGALLYCEVLIDVRLLHAPRVLCNGGDHQHSIVIDGRDLQRMTGSESGDLVAERHERVTRPAAR